MAVAVLVVGVLAVVKAVVVFLTFVAVELGGALDAVALVASLALFTAFCARACRF